MPRRPKQMPEKHCLYCGAVLERKRYNGQLEDSGRFLRRKYCNLQCAGAGNRKENPTTDAYRKRVYPLRGSQCEICGTLENLNIHHVDGDVTNEAPSNLMTLCASCHTKLHWKNGKTASKRQSVCKVCGAPARWMDMCGKHYQRFKKYGDPCLTKKQRGSSFVLIRVDE